MCSTSNVDLVRSLCADQVIDCRREDFTRAGRRYDIVPDLVGNHSLTGFQRALTPTGTLILSGGGVYEGGSLVGPMGLFLKRRLVAHFSRRRLLELPAGQTRANLATLRELAESGKIPPVVERTCP